MFSELLDIRAEIDPDTHPAFTCSMLTIETLEQDVKYVQI